MSIGGVETKKQHEGPRYTAIYEIDSPQVLLSPEWAKQRGGRPLAEPGAPLHPQPPARAVQGEVGRSTPDLIRGYCAAAPLIG